MIRRRPAGQENRRDHRLGGTTEALEVRPATRGDARRMGQIHVDSWRETYAALLPAPFLINMSAERMASYYAHGISQTAAGCGTLVCVRGATHVSGFATYNPCRLTKGQGEISTLYVDPNDVGRGIGSALLSTALHALADRGFALATVRVLKGNPAHHFYRVMGGRKTGEIASRMAGAAITEEIFVFDTAARTA